MCLKVQLIFRLDKFILTTIYVQEEEKIKVNWPLKFMEVFDYDFKSLMLRHNEGLNNKKLYIGV